MSEVLLRGAYVIMGVAFGIVVAGGLFAFVTTIGVVTRLAAGTKTAKHVMLYETFVVFGVTASNVFDLYRLSVPLGTIVLVMYGLFSGVFVGCLAAALAEVVQVLPVFIHRIHLRVGLPVVLLVFAVGKGLGSWYQLIFGTGK